MSNTKHLAVIFSDWHVNLFKRHDTNGSRLDHCTNVLMDIGAFCATKDIKTILFTGDMTDTHRALLIPVAIELIKVFKEFAKAYPEITIYAIDGNHDHYSKNLVGSRTVTSLDIISEVVPSSTFKIVSNKSLRIEGEDIWLHGIPYYEFPEHYSQMLDERCAAKAKIAGRHYLLIHQTPKDADNPMIAHDTLHTDARYMDFDHTFCGHIHARKQMCEHFTVVGNPIHKDATDAGIDKGFLVMNLAKPDNGTIFVKLQNYPEFVKVLKGEELPEYSLDYAIKEANVEVLGTNIDADTSRFTSDLAAEDIVKNFWEEVGDSDNNSGLGVGIDCVTKALSNEDE